MIGFFVFFMYVLSLYIFILLFLDKLIGQVCNRQTRHHGGGSWTAPGVRGITVSLLDSSLHGTTRPTYTMREIVHLQAGQCGNQVGAKVSLNNWRYLTTNNWCRWTREWHFNFAIIFGGQVDERWRFFRGSLRLLFHLFFNRCAVWGVGILPRFFSMNF